MAENTHIAILINPLLVSLRQKLWKQTKHLTTIANTSPAWSSEAQGRTITSVSACCQDSAPCMASQPLMTSTSRSSWNGCSSVGVSHLALTTTTAHGACRSADGCDSITISPATRCSMFRRLKNRRRCASLCHRASSNVCDNTSPSATNTSFSQ